jgi:hypothetical protein
METYPKLRNKRAVYRDKLDQKNLVAQPIAYSNVALVLDEDWKDKEVVQVATRLAARRLNYDKQRARWVWHRVPTQVKSWDMVKGRFLTPLEAFAASPEGKTAAASAKTATDLVHVEGKAVGEKTLRPRVPWPNEKRQEKRQCRAAPPTRLIHDLETIYTTAADTAEAAVLKETFVPEIKPWKSLIPELSIPYREFGNPMSKARRQEQCVSFLVRSHL